MFFLWGKRRGGVDLLMLRRFYNWLLFRKIRLKPPSSRTYIISYTLQGANISHLGKRKTSFKSALGEGYVSSRARKGNSLMLKSLSLWSWGLGMFTIPSQGIWSTWMIVTTIPWDQWDWCMPIYVYHKSSTKSNIGKWYTIGMDTMTMPYESKPFLWIGLRVPIPSSE